MGLVTDRPEFKTCSSRGLRGSRRRRPLRTRPRGRAWTATWGGAESDPACSRESASARWTSPMAEQGRVDRARTGIRFGRRARAQLTLGDQRLSPGRLVGMEARGVLRGIAGVKRQGRHA